MPAMRTYLNEWHSADEEPALPWLRSQLDQGELKSEQYYREFSTTASSLDTTHQQLADALNIAPDHLLLWSGRGPTDSLKIDQYWTCYQVVEARVFGELSRVIQPEVAHLWLPELGQLNTVGTKIRQLPERSIQPLSESEPKGIKKLTSDIWAWIIK
jgi:hypothetical protein